jgi:hypothetical protein
MSGSTQDNTNLRTRKPRPKQTGTFVGTRIQPELLKKLDDWRREQPDVPTRPEALRRLAEQALRGR